MSRLIALIVLGGLCTIVLSENCIFEFHTFMPLGNSDDNIVDFTGQKISALVEGGEVYHYITGPLKVKEEIDYSFKVFYLIQSILGEKIIEVASGLQDACYFFNNIYNAYLLPIAGSHNNFPPEAEECPIDPFSAKLFPARSSDDLVAPSDLSTSTYHCEVTYFKNAKPVGGFYTNFTVVRA